jgi:tetratricopeptide (TPR) repeat protein
MNFPSALDADKTTQARALCEAGLWPELVTLAGEWRGENPSDYKALYYLGLGLRGTRQFEQAEAAYREALSLNPSDVKVWNNLAALLYDDMGCHAQAIWCLKEALRIDPYHKLGWSNLATMVGRLGHHEQAMAFADRAIALDPKLVEAHLHKGRAALALGKIHVVKEVCRALAAIEPENFRRAR